MQSREIVLIETVPQVPAGQDEGDWQLLLPAPVEHQPLPNRQGVSGDARQPADVASLERVHPCVIQAESEPRSPESNVLQSALDRTEVLVAVTDDPKPG